MNGSRFQSLEFTLVMTSPWIFSSGGSDKQFVLTNAQFSLVYNAREVPKVKAFVFTAFNLDGTLVNLTVWIPFARRSPLPLFTYEVTDPAGRLLELADCPRTNTLSFACAATKSIEFGLAPAFIRSRITGDMVANPAALTVGKAISWILPNAFGNELVSVGLDKVLNLFALTELVIKFQGSVSNVTFRMQITQTAKWSILDERLEISDGNLAIRRQIPNVGTPRVEGEIVATATFKSTKTSPSNCASSNSPLCPVAVVVFLAFPAARNPSIFNSVVPINPVTRAPAVLTFRHLIYTFLNLDLASQGYSFPLPDGVSDAFNAWMDGGLQYVYWASDAAGKVNRLNASLAFNDPPLRVCFGNICPLVCSPGLTISVAMTPAVPTPKFRVLGRCSTFSGDYLPFDRTFPAKAGSLSGSPFIKSASVVFSKDGNIAAFGITRWANFTVNFDRSVAFSGAKNAYSLQCQGRVLNTTKGILFNETARYMSVNFGEAGSENPWLAEQNDYNNTLVVVPMVNYGNLRYFRCRVCVKRSETESTCSNWFSNLVYRNYNIDTFDTDGEKVTNTTTIVTKLNTRIIKTKVVAYNPLGADISNQSSTKVNLTLDSFSYSDGGSPTSIGEVLLDTGRERKKISQFTRVSQTPFIIEMIYTSAGSFGVYFMDTFVTEVFITDINEIVRGPVVTFMGTIPLPLYRSSVSFDGVAPSYGSMVFGSSHNCFALAKSSKNKKSSARVLPDGSVICDSSMATPTAMRGNMTLQISLPCSPKLQPITCDYSRFFTSYLNAHTVDNLWLFKTFDRTIVPISELRSCLASAKVELPQRQNPALRITDLSTSERSSIYSKSANSWCTNAERVKRVTEIHSKFWDTVLSRKMAQRSGSDIIKTNWEHCFKTCAPRRRGNPFELKSAACLELLHAAPFDIGGEKESNNTAQLMSRDSKFVAYVCPNVSVAALETSSVRTRRDAALLPGTGPTTCIRSTEIYQIMVFNFEREFAPVPSEPTKEMIFDETRNPSPIFEHLQSLYAMHVTGEVTVWTTHKDFSKLAGTQSPLKPLLLYNRNVTLVRIMVETPQLGSFASAILPQALINLITEPKPCSYYLDKIEKAMLSWRGVACPTLSRAQLKPDDQGEIAPYVVHVIDADYQGWAKRKVGGNIVKTGILSTCEL